MAFTTTQLAALENAIATGTLRVKYDGIETEYRSIAELIKARDLVRSELEASGAISAPKRTSYAAFEKD